MKAVLFWISLALALLSVGNVSSWAGDVDNVQSKVAQKSLEDKLFYAIAMGKHGEERALAVIEAGADANAREHIDTYIQRRATHLTALHRAAERGLQRVVEALVAKGATVDAVAQGYRFTPLTLALANGHEDIARYLIEHGADATYVDSAGYNVLHIAAGRASPSMLELLIAKGADVNARSVIKRRPLHTAIRAENWLNAKLLIDKGAEIHDDIGEGTPLSMAAKYGGLELVKLLVAKGADVRAANYYNGMTALHEAATYGHKNIVEFLIDKGADVNASGVPQNSPYRILSTPIVGPAYRGHFEVVKVLADRGADVNFRGERGLTPLGTATFGGHRQIVEWLVNQGAEVNPFDKDYELDANNIPLLNAIYSSAMDRSDAEMVRFLVTKGAKVNVKAKAGETALSQARRYRRQDIVDLLLANGATE